MDWRERFGNWLKGPLFICLWLGQRWRWWVGLALAAVLVVLLAGCASSPGVERSVFKPWTWRPDRAAKLAQAEGRLDASEREMVRAAQVEHVKTVEALAAAPESRPVEVATRTARNTESMLAQAAGPVPVAEATESRNLVHDLLSEQVELRRAAEARQAEAEADAAALGARIVELQALIAERDTELKAAYVKERRDADFKHAVFWIAGALVGLWLLSQVLAMAARVNPAYAGAAALANAAISPVISHAYQRAQRGLEQVGRGMATVRAKLPEVAERVEELMDGELDEDHKAVARRGAYPAGGGA